MNGEWSNGLFIVHLFTRSMNHVVAPSAAPEFAGTEALPSLLGRSV
jgi:hypothetical protein